MSGAGPGGGFERIRTSYAYRARGDDETSFRVDDVRFPSGREGRYTFAEYPFEVCLTLPVTDDGRLLLIRQFRYPIGETLLEIPAGSPHRDESLEDCARRETAEETGLRPRELEHLITVYPSPGSTNERAHIYLGTGLERVEVEPDADEVTTPLLVTVAEAERLLHDGELQQAGAALAVALFLQRPSRPH